MSSSYAVIVVTVLLMRNSESALPYQSADPVHVQHMLENDASPVVPNRADVKSQVQQLPSTYIPESNWLPADHGLGTVSAVAFDNADNVVVFHRADRVWTQQTFDPQNNRYRGDRKPIATATMVAYSRRTGTVSYRLGENLFYMPHGLTIDAVGYIYVTDVALHQVMKLRRNDSTDKLTIEWQLGSRFKPGRSDDTFCKPTAVAVLPNGEFFVADGYCNARIIKYSREVKLLLKWGLNAFSGPAWATPPPNWFSVPHALTLVADRGWLCVADREHGRVQCFDTDGEFKRQYHSPLIGDRLFSVAYAPVDGGRLYVVNGPDLGLVKHDVGEVLGFVVDVETGAVLSKFTPQTLNSNVHFTDPHDVIVSEDGLEVYVADLKNMAYKLISADPALYNKSLNLPVFRPNTTTDDAAAARGDLLKNGRRQRSTVLLIASLTGVFACLIIVLVVLISRRRSRDVCCCCCCGRGGGSGGGIANGGTQRRRHAWDFPSAAAESLRMSHFLDGKGNFEQLNQEDDVSGDEDEEEEHQAQASQPLTRSPSADT